MADDRSVLRWVSWRDCCPWLVLLRAFSISISVRSLMLATAGTVLVSLGWWLIALMLFGGDPLNVDPDLLATIRVNESLPGTSLAETAGPGFEVPHHGRWLPAWLPVEPVLTVWRKLSDPFVQFFNPSHSVRQLSYYLCGGFWTLVVWGFFGGALARIGVVQLGREERVGLVESTRYARRYLLSYLGGPLFPIVGLLVAAIPIVILGWIMLLDVGVFVGGLLWLFVILDGLIMAILALGILFGWPLMWGTIAAEGSDAFDSLSRCFAYTYQRPLHYAFYFLVVVLFGSLCWIIVSLFADLVMELPLWAVAWGAGYERINPVTLGLTPHATGSAGAAFSWGAWMIAFWVGCVQAVAAAWQYAFFFISLGGVYLLVRRDVDQTETDEVYVEESDETYGMPPLTEDENGVPQAADMPDPKPAGETPAGDDAAGLADAAE